MMFLFPMILLVLFHAIAVAAQPVWGVSVTCVDDNCSLAANAISEVLNVTEADIFVWGVDEIGQLEMSFLGLDNQSLYSKLFVVKSDPAKNAPLARAKISYIKAAMSPFYTAAPPTSLAPSPTVQYNSTVSGATHQDSSLSTGGIIGIAISLAFLSFVAIFAFSKWYMWRYQKSQRYNLDIATLPETSEKPPQGDDMTLKTTGVVCDAQGKSPAVSDHSQPSNGGEDQYHRNDDFEFVVE